jgi:hypothetical protein
MPKYVYSLNIFYVLCWTPLKYLITICVCFSKKMCEVVDSRNKRDAYICIHNNKVYENNNRLDLRSHLLF